MKINAQIPALYYASLLVNNKLKAQALLTYCITIATGYRPSARNFSALIGLGKSQSALWIIEFEKAIFEENRTDNGRQQSPISGTFEPQNNYIESEKSDTNRTVSSHTVDTQDSSNSVESDILSLWSDSSHVGAQVSCKISPLRGISFTGARDSFSQRRQGKKLKEIRNFQTKVRNEMVKLKGRLGIEINKDTISFNARQLIMINGKVVSKKIALNLWNKLFLQKDSLIRAFLFVQSAPVADHFFFKNGELFLINSGEAA